MKKIAILGLGFFIIFTSCKKEEVSTPGIEGVWKVWEYYYTDQTGYITNNTAIYTTKQQTTSLFTNGASVLSTQDTIYTAYISFNSGTAEFYEYTNNTLTDVYEIFNYYNIINENTLNLDGDTVTIDVINNELNIQDSFRNIFVGTSGDPDSTDFTDIHWDMTLKKETDLPITTNKETINTKTPKHLFKSFKKKQ